MDEQVRQESNRVQFEVDYPKEKVQEAPRRVIIPGYSEFYYQRPIEEQIEVIRGFWPQLNPGSCIHDLAGRMPLFGSEDVFAVPKWERIASLYGDALEKEAFAALYDLHKGNFYSGSRFQILGTDHLRQYERTSKALARLYAEQDGDVLIIQGQMGVRHRERSSVGSRKVYMLNEFGLTVFAVACMLLTHLGRLTHQNDMWVDCPGDEYRHYGREFNHSPCFFFHAGKVFFSTYPNDVDFKNCGPATGLTFGTSAY